MSFMVGWKMRCFRREGQLVPSLGIEFDTVWFGYECGGDLGGGSVGLGGEDLNLIL